MFGLVQAHFLPALLGNNLGQFVPDLTLLLVVAWAVFLPANWAISLAFFCGLAFDFLSSPQLSPLGLNALLYALAALLLSFTTNTDDTVFRRGSNLIRVIPLTLLTVLVYRVLLLLIGQFLGYNTVQLQVIIQAIVPAAILNAALMLIFYGPIRLISRIGVPKEIM